MALKETNIFKVDANGAVVIAPDAVLMSVVDLSVDAGVTITGPLVLLGIYVNVAMSAHDVLIKDNATTKITLPASTAAGTNMNCYGSGFTTSLVVTPNASSTGTITIFYKLV